jgi:methionine synthase II (cobalamin-independent)
MKRSTHRFPTTHDGSLARPGDLLELMFAKERGLSHDHDLFESSVRSAVADVVGKENLIGGSDCGFSSFANKEPEIHPTIVWEKFCILAEGARRASKELW